ncbi:SPOR domain-containing protein [Trinickia fusca]|uniref:SPOR domain-containing protein n=1 Tax=Trinickia fusca TaxID=2419777 RepID=A0A494XFW6_9BURK|nr:SPOR domain-containing protein [Trinickia fusca]RKP47436.1 SPOR domain-containing protein [Trinickia fusca]
MGLFSFGNKDDASRRRGANAKPARSEGVERRSRRTERTDADAMLLDPTLPEKQRARRRLVGAIALVVAAVIILPMVLDSHPKPVTDDIAIDIPNRPATVPANTRNDDAPVDTQAGVAPDSASATAGAAPLASATEASPTPAAASDEAGKSAKTAKSGKLASTQPSSSSEPAHQAAGAKPQQQPAVAATQAAKSAQGAVPESGTPAAPAGARFAVQLGVFTDEAGARNWETKLRAAGVPAYLEHRKLADGSTRTLLRAGPFADRGAASAAIAKVREAGLGANVQAGAAQ